MLRVSTIAVAVALTAASAAAGDHQFRAVYKFTDVSDGAGPILSARDRSGNLFGVTASGGSSTACVHGCGTVFKLTPDGTKTVLHTFDTSDGSGPTGVALDRDGTLYGTTEAGTLGTAGSIFKLTKDGQLSVLFSFPAFVKHHVLNAPDGLRLESGLLIGHDGNLYGTASYGGTNIAGCGEGGCGTVFKLTKAGAFTLLHAFGGESGDGCHPGGGLIQDKQGMVYGATVGCGHTDFGTVYKVDPATGTTTTLYTFTGGSDGDGPVGDLAIDGGGNLYGLTQQGGNPICNGGLGCGTVYKVTPGGAKTIFYAFSSYEDGYFPNGSLYRDRLGNLYGTTYFGGPTARFTCRPVGCGSVFKIKPDGKKVLLHAFTASPLDAALPFFHLVPGAHDATLYGTTLYTGQLACCGIVFAVNKK
jgi:uncharacterized repeat protein (TIGR03803 family)